MSNVIGDVGELSDRTVIVPVVHEIVGKDASFHFRIKDDPSISHYLSAFASVRITGALQFELSAPVSSTVAASAVIAVVPDKYNSWPTTRLQVQQLEGAINVKDAILVPSSLKIEGRVRQVATSLQPATLIDFPPVIVGHLSVAGGVATTTTILTVHVPIVVDGVAHRKTW
jgi:hypothetical protein